MPDTFSNTHGTFTKTGYSFSRKNKSSKNSINIENRNCLVSQWLGLYTSNVRGLGSILVGELKSHKLSGVTKKKKKKTIERRIHIRMQ